MLAQLTDLEVDNAVDRFEGDTITKVHWRVRDCQYRMKRAYKVVLGIRDPRDAAVSLYYQLGRSIAGFTPKTLSLSDYIRQVLLSIEPHRYVAVNGYGVPSCSWPAFYREWTQNGVDCISRHEDVLDHTQEELERIADTIGMPITGDMGAVVRRFAGAMRSVYNQNYMDCRPSQAKVRRGCSVWAQHLLGIDEALIWEHCKDVMLRFGYV